MRTLTEEESTALKQNANIASPDPLESGIAVLLAHAVDHQPGDRTEHDITLAHHAVCTCGGAGPGEGCPACEMWHVLYPQKEGVDGVVKT